MSLEQRIESLRRRHSHIEALLASEEARPMPDTALITQLKKEKLLLKDEIEKLRSGKVAA